MNTRFLAFIGGLIWYILVIPLMLLATLGVVIVIVLTPLQILVWVIQKVPIKPKLEELFVNIGGLSNNFIIGFENANENLKYAFTGKM
jgi:hypothetical protein